MRWPRERGLWPPLAALSAGLLPGTDAMPESEDPPG